MAEENTEKAGGAPTGREKSRRRELVGVVTSDKMTKTRVVLRIVLPAALPGVMSGIMLAVARIAGETAPLLLAVFGNVATNTNPFSGPQAALPLFVFSEAGNNNQTAIDRAWTGALVLIILVMIFNLIARLGVYFLNRKRA